MQSREDAEYFSENKTAESFQIEPFKLCFLMKSSICKQNKKHSISGGKIRRRYAGLIRTLLGTG